MKPKAERKKTTAKTLRAARNSASKPRIPRTESVVALRRQLEEKLQLLSDANRQLKRKIFDLYTVFEISRNFNAVLDYHMLVDTFIFTCLGQVAATRGAIFLKHDSASHRFDLAKFKGSGEPPHATSCFVLETRLMQYLAKLNRPVVVDDLLREVADDEESALLLQFPNGIVVPLIYQTRLSGVFLMSGKLSDAPFTNDDIEFLSILGNQIAVAIENARLYEGERRATQELRSAQQLLLQTEKLAALGEMSAKIAHEVNNPLGIIKNYVLLTKREAGGHELSEKYLGIVGDEIDRIARIVRQLLEFHRPGEATLEPVNLNHVISDVLGLVDRQLASHDIKVETHLDARNPIIIGSSENLKQVFLNLIINARDAMKTGGKLTVTTTVSEHEVVTRCCDSGPGIPAEIIPRIFEPFFTTKEPGEGTGLGLSVCYGIIKAHNGSIEFRNLDKGGCFIIRLPLGEVKGADEHVV